MPELFGLVPAQETLPVQVFSPITSPYDYGGERKAGWLRLGRMRFARPFWFFVTWCKDLLTYVSTCSRVLNFREFTSISPDVPQVSIKSADEGWGLGH